jgi:hypothetical protein
MLLNAPVCKFCRGLLKPNNTRQAPRGYRFYDCEICDLPNVFPVTDNTAALDLQPLQSSPRGPNRR